MVQQTRNILVEQRRCSRKTFTLPLANVLYHVIIVQWLDSSIQFWLYFTGVDVLQLSKLTKQLVFDLKVEQEQSAGIIAELIGEVKY